MKIPPSISTFEKRNGGGDSTICRIGEPVLFFVQKSVRNRQIEKLEKTKLQIIKLFGTLYAHAVCEHPSI